jgi:aldose 1-epimerase
LRSYSFGDRPVIEGFGLGERCHDGRGQVLAPWPNRLGDGRYEFEGQAAQAALDEPSRSNAIHGLVRWLPWRVEHHAPEVLVMGCVVHAQPGYPWRLRLGVEYRVGTDGLTVTATATNESPATAPFGIGFHPYLTVGTATIDDAELSFGAGRRLLTDDRGLPTGSVGVPGTELDFSAGRPIGSTRLDTAFFELRRDDSGRARAELRTRGAAAEVWLDNHFPYLMVYTADHVETARGSIALEPMSCPPDAFRSGTDLVRLAPGAEWRGRWGISPRTT